MWPFRTVRPVVDEAHLELVQQIHGLTLEVKAIRDDLAALEGRHERLRGRFYGARMHRAEGELPSKAEALQRFLQNRERGSNG